MKTTYELRQQGREYCQHEHTTEVMFECSKYERCDKCGKFVAHIVDPATWADQFRIKKEEDK